MELELKYSREGTEETFIDRYFIERYSELDSSNFNALFEKFTDEIKKLIILGEPGSGKTVLLLQFAQRLVSLAALDPTYPIPVMLNLASWKNEYQHFEEWLEGVLVNAAGASGISKAYARELTTGRHLLLLLDGLDEIPTDHRDSCLEKLHDYLLSIERAMPLSAGFPVAIICSRRVEYTEMKNNAPVRGAVAIMPLSQEKITDWLTNAQQDKDAAKITLQNIKQHSFLSGYLKTAFQMYLTLNLAHKLDFKSINDQKLIDTYINSEIERTRLWEMDTANRYLSFLATVIQSGNKSVTFELADLQINLIRNRILLNFSNGLVCGILCVIFHLIIRPRGVTSLELTLLPFIMAVVFAIVGKLPIPELKRSLKPFKWYLKRFSKRLLTGLVVGIIVYILGVGFTKLNPPDIQKISIIVALIPVSLDFLLIAFRFVISKFYLASQIVNGPVEIQEIRFFQPTFNRRLFRKGFVEGFNFSIITGLCVGFIMLPIIFLADLHHEFESKYLNGVVVWLIVVVLFMLCFTGYGLVLGSIRGTVNSFFPIKAIPSLNRPYVRFYSQFLFDFFQTTLAIAALIIPMLFFVAPESVPIFIMDFFAGTFLLTFLLSPLYKHSLLRVFLFLEQKLPLRLTYFLDKIGNTGLMEKDGGQWRFRHQLIQDRLSGKELN